MKRQQGNITAKDIRGLLLASLLACGVLAGCAGPSTRILPGDVVAADDQPHEMPKENQVLEEVNPFYLQESLDYLSGFVRQTGTPGEQEAAAYIRQLLDDYGYETRLQRFSAGGVNVTGSRKAPSPDSDILIIAASHDSLPQSPGANNNASGVVTLLECARLLSRLSTDTELRFVSFSGSHEGHTGAAAYVDSLTEQERHRVIGLIELDTLGYVADARIALGTVDGKETLLGNLLKKAYRDVPGLTSGWQYTLKDEGSYIPFVMGGVPALTVGQVREAYENGTPQDRADTVNVELLAGVVDIVSHTAAGIMSGDTPSQLAKSRYMNNLQEGVWIQRRDVRVPFGESHEQVSARLGTAGTLALSKVDGAGRQVDTYQYLMKWFDVDQIILTNYHYSDGKLETISLDADGAGVEFEEMKERIGSWYGEPVGENSGPSGTEYDWTDPLYHRFIALIPGTHGFEVEMRDYTPEKTETGTYLPDGTVVAQDIVDPRTARLLNLVRGMIPRECSARLSAITLYTDGVGDTKGYLEMPEAEPEERPQDDSAEAEAEGALRQAVLWVDIEDALTADGQWRNQTDTVRLLAGCCGQLLELNGNADYMTGYRERFLDEETAVAAAADGNEAPAPDFSTDFMRFVLFQKPDRTQDISDGRIQFFYNYEELVKIRAEIRKNLKLNDEKSTELLPPESGSVPPEP